jgi:nitroimidazol reductase NimA-like FMN-containing flavoprotein (pyridoxamine 5'-phosphate oxidase superfamily)
MSINIKGPWQHSDVEQFLQQAKIPMRLACNAEDGFPRVVSLWYQYEDGQLLCVTHRDSKIVALLRKDPKIGFEVAPNEPPYCGVRGQATARLQSLDNEATLKQLLERYLGESESKLGQWLLSRSAEEILICISPERLYTWDYRERMSDTAGGMDND